MKTVKRKAVVGERVLITDRYRTEDRYKNGDILTVTSDGKGFRVYSDGMVIFTEEYEVIIEEANDMKNGIIEQMQAEINELKSKVAALEGKKSLKEMADEVSEIMMKGPCILPKSPQQIRDEIVAKAKADIEGVKEYWDAGESMRYFKGNYVVNASFTVNKEKRTVVAILRHRHEGVVARGIAKADPSDCFNVHIGKAIALRRALGKPVPRVYLDAPAPTEARVGDVIRSKETLRGYTVVEDKYLSCTKTECAVTSPVAKKHGIIVDDSRE